MPQPKQYHISFSELGDEDVYVLSFKGEESLTRPFVYRIELLSQNRALDTAKILNKPATLRIERDPGQDPHEIHGIISRFKQRGQEPMTSYYVELVPRLWLLGLTKQNAVYQYTTLQDLISQMMTRRDASGESYGMEIPCRFELDSNPPLEYVVQYRETNLDFLHRRLEHFGVSYFIDHSSGEDVVVFSDKNEAFPAIDHDGALKYRSSSSTVADPEPTVTNWIYEEQVLTGLFKMKDYNPQTPSTALEVESQLNGEAPGLQYEFGDHFVDQDAGKALVRIRNQETLCRQKEVTANSDMRVFRAGCTFELGSHYRDEWNQSYLITAMECEGSQWGAFGHLESAAEKDNMVPYRNTFTAIPATVVFRPVRSTRVPRIPGIMSAMVESSQQDDEYAFIDEAGRYKVRMLFDLMERDQTGDASVALRQVQPYSGNDYGMHFPSHAGAEMVWACVDGDPDRPVALGTVPHQEAPSPVHAELKTQSTIRTAGLNELTFDDKADEERIFLNGTKNWDTTIANDKTLAVGNDEISEVGNNKTVTVGADESLNVGNDQFISIGNNLDRTIGADQVESIGGNKTINVDGDHDESISGGANISVDGDESIAIGENQSTRVGANMSLDVSKNYTESISSNSSSDIGDDLAIQVGKNAELQVGKKTTLQSGDNIVVTGRKKALITIQDELLIKCGRASISMKKNGDISIKGAKINVKGSGTVTIKGSKIAEN